MHRMPLRSTPVPVDCWDGDEDGAGVGADGVQKRLEGKGEIAEAVVDFANGGSGDLGVERYMA